MVGALFCTVSGECDKFNDALEKVSNNTASSNNADTVQIKLESPKLAKLKQRVGILKAGKHSLRRCSTK